MHKTWLEVALNGAWGKDVQPHIPVRVDDIVAEGLACVAEGAAIVHVHAYDETTGRQDDDADTYARIIEGIRSRADCIVYPTLPTSGEGLSVEERFRAVENLARRALLEWAVVDPGSVNLDDFVYVNPDAHVRHGLALAARHGFHPSYAIYEPGFVRLGAARAREAGALPQPVYRFMFSDDLPFGFPPAPYALEAYLELLGREAPGAPWMVAGLSVDVLPLVAAAIERGGHVRVGLEDAPHGSRRSNVEWTRAARRAIEAAGGRLASSAEVRAALKQR